MGALTIRVELRCRPLLVLADQHPKRVSCAPEPTAGPVISRPPRRTRTPFRFIHGTPMYVGWCRFGISNATRLGQAHIRRRINSVVMQHYLFRGTDNAPGPTRFLCNHRPVSRGVSHQRTGSESGSLMALISASTPQVSPGVARRYSDAIVDWRCPASCIPIRRQHLRRSDWCRQRRRNCL